MIRHSQGGAALVLTLMITALVAGLGGALLLVTSVETAIEAHHQQIQRLRQAADAGLGCAMSGLRAAPDWSGPLAGAPVSGIPCLAPVAVWPGGIDPAALTASLRSEAAARYGPAPDAPAWVLWQAGAAPAAARPDAPPVVFIWITDDIEDGDADPGSDANGLVWIRVTAVSHGSARRILDAIVQRDPAADGEPRVVGWRATR